MTTQHASLPRAPSAEDGSVHDPDADPDRRKAYDEPRELTSVDIDTFEATF